MHRRGSAPELSNQAGVAVFAVACDKRTEVGRLRTFQNLLPLFEPFVEDRRTGHVLLSRSASWKMLWQDMRCKRKGQDRKRKEARRRLVSAPFAAFRIDQAEVRLRPCVTDADYELVRFVGLAV